MNTLNTYFEKLKTHVSKSEIENHLKFVVYMAKKISYYYKCVYLFEDLIQAGNLGLIKAVSKYNPEKNIKFISYAVYWIRSMMFLEIKSQNLIRLPNNQINNGTKHTQVLSYESMCDGTDENDFDEGDMKKFNLIEYPDFREDLHEQLFIKMLMKKIYDRMSEILTDTEKKVVEFKYMMKKSYSQIGESIGRTKQRAKQIDDISMNKLRSDEEIQKLYPLYLQLA